MRLVKDILLFVVLFVMFAFSFNACSKKTVTGPAAPPDTTAAPPDTCKDDD